MWKNGIKSTIAIVGTFFNLIDITNEHNDIYIAATQFNNDKTQLKVWKNGIGQNLAVNTSVFGRTFKVSNGDFYWGGVQDGMLINNTNAIYLKNESFFSLNNRLRSQVNDIFVERIEK
jgi:hypothetical protein